MQRMRKGAEMNMREQMARAMSLADGGEPDVVTIIDGKGVKVWETYLSCVDAALDAMREPSEGMTEDAAYQSGAWSRRNLEAMIDAIRAGK